MGDEVRRNGNGRVWVATIVATILYTAAAVLSYGAAGTWRVP